MGVDDAGDRDPAARELLDDHRVGRQVEAHAAVLLGDRHPEQAELLHLLDDRLRELVLVVEVLGGGEDLLVDELAHHLGDRLLDRRSSRRRWRCATAMGGGSWLVRRREGRVDGAPDAESSARRQDTGDSAQAAPHAPAGLDATTIARLARRRPGAGVLRDCAAVELSWSRAVLARQPRPPRAAPCRPAPSAAQGRREVLDPGRGARSARMRARGSGAEAEARASDGDQHLRVVRVDRLGERDCGVPLGPSPAASPRRRDQPVVRERSRFRCSPDRASRRRASANYAGRQATAVQTDQETHEKPPRLLPSRSRSAPPSRCARSRSSPRG